MTNVKSVNFYDLCRICTATTEQKIDIFSPEGKTKNLCAKINECLPLTVEEKDRLPKVLCSQCIQHLDTYTEFRNICRNSQIMLTSCLNTASAQNGGKVLIKDILSTTAKTLGGLSNTSNLNVTNNADQLQNVSTQSLNQSIAAQLQLQSQQQVQPQQQQQQQLFTIQGSNVMAQSIVNPLTISSAGNLQNQEFLNSIMQAVGIQSEQVKIEKPPMVPQYTITVDNSIQLQQQQQQQTLTQINAQPVTPNKEKEQKNNALEEFLKMKPNIKVTPISKKQQQQQQQQDQQQQEQQQFQQQQQELQQQLQQQQQQQEQQQHQQQQQQQQQLVQFQLQQILQQQLQQQQLQQQLQILTSQLQPQQITITAPCLQQQITQQQPLQPPQTGTAAAPQILQSSTINTDNSLNDNNNDDLSPSKNKKPKLNFVLTPPTNHNQTTIPQLTNANTTYTQQTQQQQPTTPQIQLQFQPTLTPQTTLQLQTAQHQQQNQNAATAALLSNLAPLLQPQTQLNAALQSQALTSVAQNAGANMMSPNKCFLPITIKDENTDQQFVAHIDAKNFLLPTTYQLQMKLQPQIATADGQPIMQLAPTSIPATLQLAPQALNANQTFQAAAVAAFNNNTNLPTQSIQQQQQPPQQQTSQPLQTTQIQQQVLQQITNTQVQQQQTAIQQQPTTTLPAAQPPQTPLQPTTQLKLSKNVQITSQQVLNPGHKKPLITTSKSATETANINETNKPIPKAMTTQSQGKNDSGLNSIVKQQKYKISQQPGSNTIEITPTTSFTQQIMQQVQQQQQQKQKLNQQQNSSESPTTTTVTTQHGGITVQRVTNKLNPTPSTGNTTNDTITHSTRQATITPINQTTTQQQQSVATLPKLPILNKQNITISRITPQSQQQKLQQQQQSTKPQVQQIGNTTLKVVQQPTKSQATATSVQITPAQQTSLPTSANTQQQQQQQQIKPPTNQQQTQKPQIISNISNIPNTTLRISPVKKVIKKQIPKPLDTIQTTTATATLTNQQQQQQQQPTVTITNTTTTTPTSATNQIQYVTDITTILPPATSNENNTSSIDDKNSTGNTSSTTNNDTPAKNNLECNQCGRVFKKKEHLTQHVKLHSGVRPFKCNEEGCTKAFHRKEHLLRHLVSHSGKKMFSCDICQKPFSRKDNLSKHRKIHTEQNVNNYICEVCNKTFAVKTYYEQHKLLHQTKATTEEDKKAVNETITTKDTNETNNDNNSNNNNNTNQIEYQTQTPLQQQQKNVTQQQQQQITQQQQNQQQQLQLVQQQLQQIQQQNQAQTQQIMHLQLPTSIVTTQDMAGNTITITQANDPQANALKTLTLSGNTGITQSSNGNHHDTTVLNLPTSLANFVQLSQAQFVNATTGQIMGHLKLEK